MNILIIAYCGLDDGFLFASNALENIGYKIHFCPYLSYIMDKIENKDELVINQIIDNNIDICLWWTNNVSYESFLKIINYNSYGKSLKHYFYNWDAFLYNYEKYNSLVWKDRIEKRKLIYPLMTHVFSCNEKEIDYFKSYWNTNTPNISYISSGFDRRISYYEYHESYICDVSIVLTNLYKNNEEFPESATNITRYEIVDKLYENRDKINFHIYGFENLKELYPDCYKGFVKYRNCNKVFSNSKVNLSIHPIVNELNGPYSKEEYFSERVPQILGSKGLLLTNSYLSTYIHNNEDYIYIDKYMDWFSKIMDIIENSEKYDIIRENGYKKSLEYYQWNNWANKLDQVIKN